MMILFTRTFAFAHIMSPHEAFCYQYADLKPIQAIRAQQHKTLRTPNVIQLLWSKNSIVFSLLFLYLIIFTLLWTLTRGKKRGLFPNCQCNVFIFTLQMLGSAKTWRSADNSRKRPNVINGCHLRGVGWGWIRKRENVIQRRLLLKKKVH